MVSMAGNFLLAGFKFAAGFIGRSDAMISDAVHSSSDIVGSLIVLAGSVISGKDADREHPYGHERFESIASLTLSFLLLFAALEIMKSGLGKIISGSYKEAAIPGMISLIAAVISIVSKELMFWYTMHFARKIDSGSLKAEAWHHRSDSLSSVGSLAGIAGARMGWKILDPLAALLIGILIARTGLEIFKEAIDKLTDHACSRELEEKIRSCVQKQDDVRGIDVLRTREFGRMVYLDLEVRLDKELSLGKAHQSAEILHDTIEQEFPEIKHVMIHVNPA